MLKVDPKREHLDDTYVVERNTGIFVRAKHSNGSWCSIDIATLTAESLLEWLRSRGGKNPWAENVVGILLGHDGRIAEDTE